MFDNIAINVTIGLALIYLLYSLLVTILGEMISSWLGIRPRMLRMAITRMLNDGGSRQKAIARFFLQTPIHFDSTFAGKFYATPSIKYLARLEKDQKRMFGQTKPAYISAGHFATTLINMCAEKGQGADKYEQVKFCLQFNTFRIEQETRDHLLNLLSNAGANIDKFQELLEQWFTETMDRTNGWYKDRMKLIAFWTGFLLALVFNVNTIHIAKILANDKEARAQLVNMGIELAKDSARYEPFTAAGTDSLRNQASIDSGISRITKDINYANMILGLGWGSDKQVIHETRELEPGNIHEKAALEHWVTISARLHPQQAVLLQHWQQTSRRLDSMKREGFKLKLDTALAARSWRLAVAAKNAAAVKQTRLKLDTALRDLRIFRNMLADDSISFQRDSVDLVSMQANFAEMNKAVNSFLKKPFRHIDSIYAGDKPSAAFLVAGTTGYTTWDKVKYTIVSAAQPASLAGLLLTALALSLGAPFWFDLLKKIMSIRAAGVKPEEKPVTETPILKISDNPQPPLPPVISNVVEKAMLLHAAAIRSIAGVQAVFPVYNKKTAAHFLQVNVDAAATQLVVTSQFSRLVVDGMPVTVTAVVTGIATEMGSPRIIQNAHRLDFLGSLGCILKNKNGSEKHLISCFHVLNGTTRYDEKDNFTTIVDREQKPLGKRDAGGIAHSYDYGLAQVFPERDGVDNQGLFKSLGISTSVCRAVSADDIRDQVPVMFLDIHTGKKKTGFLYTVTPTYTVKYEDKPRELTNLLVLTADVNNPATISSRGNSGAIVFTTQGDAIGMIVAGDQQYTYAMELAGALSNHQELTIEN